MLRPYDLTLKIWNLEEGTTKKTLRGHDGYVLSCAYSFDGKQILSCSNDNTVRLWSAINGAQIMVVDFNRPTQCKFVNAKLIMVGRRCKVARYPGV